MDVLQEKSKNLASIERINLRRMAKLYGPTLIARNLDEVSPACLRQLRNNNLTREDFLKPGFCRELKRTAQRTIFQPGQFSAKRAINRSKSYAAGAKAISENLGKYLEQERDRKEGFYNRLARGEVRDGEVSEYLNTVLAQSIGDALSMLATDPWGSAAKVVRVIKTEGPKALDQSRSLMLGAGKYVSAGLSKTNVLGAMTVLGVYGLVQRDNPSLPRVPIISDALNKGSEWYSYLMNSLQSSTINNNTNTSNATPVTPTTTATENPAAAEKPIFDLPQVIKGEKHMGAAIKDYLGGEGGQVFRDLNMPFTGRG